MNVGEQAARLPWSGRATRRRRGAARTGESILLVTATAALLAATAWRASDPGAGADVGAALSALGAQLPVTLPAAGLVSLAMALNVAAGAGLLRLVRRRPFADWAEAVLGGAAAAVVLDVALVSLLGGLGWFRAVPLAAALAAAAVAGVAQRPFCSQRPGVGRVRPARLLLVLVAWSGVLLVGLASPVVPAADVLPNHVAPAEHLRVFGSIATLATYPSPIYGPSRLFLGDEALVGTLATLTGLPAVLAVAASIPWLVGLTVLAARRLAVAAFGRGAAFWAVVAMLLSFTFVRLADVRDSVTALPFAALVLAAVAGSHIERRRADPDRRKPDWTLVAALAAATLVHPLVGTLTGLAVAVVTLADPGRHLSRTAPALVGTAVALLPQLAVMTGLAPAPITGVLALAAGAAAALATAGALDRTGLSRIAAERIGPRRAAIAVTAAGAAAMLALAVLDPSTVTQAAAWVNPAFPLLFAAGAVALAGLVATGRGGRRLIAAGLAAGLVLLLAVSVVPDDSVVGRSLRYEVPKAVGYWLPWVCVPALAGVLAMASRRSGRQAVWLGVPAAVLAATLLPLGPVAPNASQASHPTADVVVWDLRTAQLGYWQGYPDARGLVGARGQAVDAFLVAQIAAGRLDASDRLLHVAASYQTWASIPVAAFTGVDETMVSADAAETIFTAGGRVHPLADLVPQLRDGFAWVLLEPDRLPPWTRDAIVAAGYRSVFTTAGAEVFAGPAVEGR